MNKHWCIIVDRFFPESAGVGNSTRSIAAGLINKGYTVSVLTPRINHSHKQFECLEGIRIYRIGGKFLESYGPLVYVFYCYFFLRGLHLLRFKIRPDYVLGQTPWEGGVLSGFFGMINRKCISLVHTHGGVLYANRILPLAKLAYRINKVILVTNNDYAEQVRTLAPYAKPVIARNIFVIEPVFAGRDELRQQLEFNNDVFHVIGIGRMVYERGVETKGFSYAIRAVSKIQGAMLHLFGDGPNMLTYRSLAEQSNANVRFHGFAAKSVLYRYMKAADCFLLSSLHEGLSMSMIEAMAYGLPVITTRTSGAIDLINDGENGIIISAGNHEPIHDAICRLMSDKELCRKLSYNSLRTYEREFTEEPVLHQYIRAIKEAEL